MYISGFFVYLHLFTPLGDRFVLFQLFFLPLELFTLSWLKWVLIDGSDLYILCNCVLPRVQSILAKASICVSDLVLTYFGSQFWAFGGFRFHDCSLLSFLSSLVLIPLRPRGAHYWYVILQKELCSYFYL